MPNILTIADDPSFELIGTMPYIDGVSLVDLVTAFEVTRGYDRSELYGGMELFQSADSDVALQFLHIEPASGNPDRGERWLLGCMCGEPGCWPLYAKVSVEADLVVWKDFRHGMRRSRDYSGFGPFRFDRLQYNQAIEAVWPWHEGHKPYMSIADLLLLSVQPRGNS